MVKVTLIEGYPAYLELEQWAVLPMVDPKGAMLVGQCRVLIPGGMQVILKETTRDTADRLMADKQSRIPGPVEETREREGGSR